jgi:hypothetical protein
LINETEGGDTLAVIASPSPSTADETGTLSEADSPVWIRNDGKVERKKGGLLLITASLALTFTTTGRTDLRAGSYQLFEMEATMNSLYCPFVFSCESTAIV